MKYVSAYDVNRCYGGPEEGGWWYDVWEFVETLSAHTVEHEAHIARGKLEDAEEVRKREDGRHHDRFSVLGGADREYLVESKPAQMDTTREPIPHYC